MPTGRYRLTSHTIAFLAVTLSVPISFAAKSDRWKDLVLDESSPQQAIEICGPPNRDETGELLKLLKGRMLNGPGLLRSRAADVISGF